MNTGIALKIIMQANNMDTGYCLCIVYSFLCKTNNIYKTM